MSDDPPVPTRPLADEDTFLQQKYQESIVNQADLMDKLATQLITLELAIPGLYATVLKLVQGDEATLPANPWLLYLTFGSITRIICCGRGKGRILCYCYCKPR